MPQNKRASSPSQCSFRATAWEFKVLDKAVSIQRKQPGMETLSRNGFLLKLGMDAAKKVIEDAGEELPPATD